MEKKVVRGSLMLVLTRNCWDHIMFVVHTVLHLLARLDLLRADRLSMGEIACSAANCFNWFGAILPTHDFPTYYFGCEYSIVPILPLLNVCIVNMR